LQIEGKRTCEQHLDRCFDDFLLEQESFPHLEKSTEGCCEYCGNKAVYALIPAEYVDPYDTEEKI
jgi:CxxH/CxxC protein (TIGR04129 family)